MEGPAASSPKRPPPPRADPARLLHAALAAYGLSRRRLRRLAALAPAELHTALARPDPPPELRALLAVLAALLTPQPRERIRNAADVAALLVARFGHCDQECLLTICLDGQNGVQDIALVYQGSVCQAVVRLAEVFKRALQLNSQAIILAHNHPAGSMVPSPEDLDLTASCIALGKQLEVAVLDHLIIGAGQWVSLSAWLAARDQEPGARSQASEARSQAPGHGE